VIKFWVGFLIGCVASIIAVSLYPEPKIDGNLVVNIVIALATCIATAIHFSSIQSQRKEQIWLLNKDLLLGLTDSMNQVVKSCEAAIDLEYRSIESGKNEKYTDVGFSTSDALDTKIEYALNVYSPLMDKKLLQHLESYRTFSKKNMNAVMSDELDNIQGYEKLIGETRKAHKELLNFIASVSGIKHS
jgi:hypothetical protein